jgi:FkbM family methyltransferase
MKLLKLLIDILPLYVRTKIKHIPVIKQLQMYVFNSLYFNKEFNAKISAGPANGLIFPIKLPQDKLMWLGTWELDFANELVNFLTPKSIAYDIGGYKGYYSGVMALNGASEVFVFEPFPENAIIIKSMISLNKNLNIKLVEKAVSDKSETLNFNINSDNTMGKLQNSNFENFSVNSSQLLVETIKLDDFIESGNPVPSLIKIDVEGAEEFVLKGAINLLEQFKPTLFIEIHSNEIGIKCYEILCKYYENIFVLETGKSPSFNEQDICSYIAYN